MDLQLLGPIEATVDGRRIQLGATKQRAVLAMLALPPNRTVSVDRLIEGLWGEEAPDSAGKMVQLYVSQLRKLLDGNGAEILTHGRGYELRLAPTAVDVGRFEQLSADGTAREALALWRGDPLSDVAGEPFAAAEIRRLEELWLGATERAIDADLAAGRHAEVLPELEALVVAHPLQERLHAQRMLALYRSGRQADALAAYRAARHVLVEQIGVEPGPELRRLHDAMLAQDPVLDLPAGASPIRLPRGRSRRVLVVVGALLVVFGLAMFAATRWSESPGLPGIDENAVGVIEPDSGKITTQFTVGRGPNAIAAGGGSVWVANEHDGTVSRIGHDRDPVVIPVSEHPVDVTFAAGALWVLDREEGTVARVDPATNRVQQTLSVGNSPGSIAAGFGALWVVSEVDRKLARIDLQRGGASTDIDLGANPTAVAAGSGAVWVASEEGGIVFRVDPGARVVTETIGVGRGPVGVAVGEGAVWVANRQDATVSRIDPATDTVTAIVPVGREPGAIAAGAGGVWVASASEGAVTRIDPATRQRTESIQITGSPSAIAVADGAVWTAALAAPTSHRGGTLRVETPPFLYDRVEAGVYNFHFGQATALVYDSLIAYRRQGGSTFGALVGDLAVAVPDPSADGKTYVFKLRPGIRFSDGDPVRPEDVRASFEDLARRHGESYYKGIVGVPECAANKRPRCDLSKGIVTDAQRGTITIRLTEPDPEFLHKLAYPFTYVAPADHPFGSDTPPPGTGPYRFAHHSPTSARLVRNPHFRVWSQDRPGGFPDEVVMRGREDEIEARVAAVERGAADVVLVEDGFGGPLSPEGLRELKLRGRGQLVTNAIPSTNFMFLNVRKPPFDDVRVRQALNYAVDRREIAEVTGGSDVAEPACQFVPPGFPNYEPVCPYTVDPDPSGAWTAPDLDRARRLIAQSGTAGMDVTVWTYPAVRAWAQHVVSVLRRLGYRSSLRSTRDPTSYGEKILVRDTPAQIGVAAWWADSAAPSQFAGLFTCEDNNASFCDHGFDARVDAALAARGPEAAARWKEAYAYLSKAAPGVPSVNRRTVVFLSDRVGNFQYHPLGIALLEQLWVR